MIAFEKSILVVAHPDDEVLWFSSLIEDVNEIVICYLNQKSDPALGRGRKKSLFEHPLGSVSCLEMDESEVFDDKNWHEPVVTGYGIEIKAEKKNQKQYKENFNRLKACLYPILKNYQYVFTHNPWGEYGHEEHVQLYRVIESLQRELNLTIWYSNYVSNKSVPLMLQTTPAAAIRQISMKTKSELGASIKRLYENNGCWTWYKDWQWCDRETFFRDDAQDEEAIDCHQPVPYNMIHVDISSKSKRKRKNPFLRRLIKSVPVVR